MNEFSGGTSTYHFDLCGDKIINRRGKHRFNRRGRKGSLGTGGCAARAGEGRAVDQWSSRPRFKGRREGHQDGTTKPTAPLPMPLRTTATSAVEIVTYIRRQRDSIFHAETRRSRRNSRSGRDARPPPSAYLRHLCGEKTINRRGKNRFNRRGRRGSLRTGGAAACRYCGRIFMATILGAGGVPVPPGGVL